MGVFIVGAAIVILAITDILAVPAAVVGVGLVVVADVMNERRYRRAKHKKGPQ